MQITETMQEFVIRKLNDRALNITAMCDKLKMNRSKVYRIKKGNDTSAATMQTLHDYFKGLGE